MDSRLKWIVKDKEPNLKGVYIGGNKISEKDAATYIGLQNAREFRNEGVVSF